jgi:hypothetical protein
MDVFGLFLKRYPTETGVALLGGAVALLGSVCFVGLQAYKTWLEVVDLRRKLRPPTAGSTDTIGQEGPEKAKQKKRKKAQNTSALTILLAMAGSLSLWGGVYLTSDNVPPTLVGSEPAAGSVLERDHDIDVVLTFDEAVSSLLHRRTTRPSERCRSRERRPVRQGWRPGSSVEATDLRGNATGTKTIPMVLVSPPVERTEVIISIAKVDELGPFHNPPAGDLYWVNMLAADIQGARTSLLGAPDGKHIANGPLVKYTFIAGRVHGIARITLTVVRKLGGQDEIGTTVSDTCVFDLSDPKPCTMQFNYKDGQPMASVELTCELQ